MSLTTCELDQLEEIAPDPPADADNPEKLRTSSPAPPSPTSPTSLRSFFSTPSSIRRLLRPRQGAAQANLWQEIQTRWTNWQHFQSTSHLGKSPPRRPPFAVRNLESCPRGYPRLAAFLDSDESFSIYRRFGYAQARLLLEKQDEMRLLEEGLIEMDKEDERTGSQRLICRDDDPKRGALQKLETTFQEYVPIYVLYHLVNDVATNKAYAVSIGVLLVFTLAFSAMLSLFTRARRHEIFGAAAA
ncbi:MAG: hypothetical protein Q9160_009067 [Pyrenula sp. 1 TL-2023]